MFKAKQGWDDAVAKAQAVMPRMAEHPWIVAGSGAAALLILLIVFFGWTAGVVVVGFIAALVALFKDEFWHWRHAPGLDVALVAEPYPSFGYSVRLKNPSERLSAEGASVRVLEFEPHPLEYATGPKWSNHIIQVDRLVPRASGETTFVLAPEAEVRLPLFSVGGAWTDEEHAVASFPWWEGMTTVAGAHEGLLVLPSTRSRDEWIHPHPDLRAIEGCPAMVRLEVSATNVPARLYTVKITRDVDAWPGEAPPGNPSLHRDTFSVTLEPGSSPYNPTPHASQMMPAEEPDVEEAEGHKPPTRPAEPSADDTQPLDMEAELGLEIRPEPTLRTSSTRLVREKLDRDERRT
jgi:hypothetical protein